MLTKYHVAYGMRWGRWAIHQYKISYVTQIANYCATLGSSTFSLSACSNVWKKIYFYKQASSCFHNCCRRWTPFNDAPDVGILLFGYFGNPCKSMNGRQTALVNNWNTRIWWPLNTWYWFRPMMTSWNENKFRVTGPLCGEFTVPRWISHTKASDAELWCFLWSALVQTVQ